MRSSKQKFPNTIFGKRHIALKTSKINVLVKGKHPVLHLFASLIDTFY